MNIFSRLIAALLMLGACLASLAHAGEDFQRPARPGDVTGMWEQVNFVAFNARVDARHRFYTGKQLFWFFPDGGVKHIEYGNDTLTSANFAMWKAAPVIQQLTWQEPGQAVLKHPERPPAVVGFIYFLGDRVKWPAGAVNTVRPRMGDLLYVDFADGKPAYMRLLRPFDPRSLP